MTQSTPFYFGRQLNSDAHPEFPKNVTRAARFVGEAVRLLQVASRQTGSFVISTRLQDTAQLLQRFVGALNKVQKTAAAGGAR